MLDNLDAKLHMALAAARNDASGENLGGDFTEKIWALGTRLFRPDGTGQGRSEDAIPKNRDEHRDETTKGGEPSMFP